MTIHKFTLTRERRQQVAMPVNAEILACQMQGSSLCLWAMVDPARGQELREIHIYGTCHEFSPVGMMHLGTVQDGSYVWHVFEKE